MLRLKIHKSRVWIRSHIDNKNTQRRFKINIKELTSDNFLNALRGFNGVKGVLFQNPPMRFKK
ncbi:hypothetical protein HpBT331_03210 [Helicobacter pylori]